MTTKTDSIITTVSELYLDEHGIVRMNFPKENVKVHIEDSRKIYQGRMKLPSEGSQQLLLVDLRTNPKPDRESRNYAKSDEVVSTTKAMAMLVGGPVSRILGNFFLGFNKGKIPVRLFSEEDEAITWLLKNR